MSLRIQHGRALRSASSLRGTVTRPPVPPEQGVGGTGEAVTPSWLAPHRGASHAGRRRLNPTQLPGVQLVGDVVCPPPAIAAAQAIAAAPAMVPAPRVVSAPAMVPAPGVVFAPAMVSAPVMVSAPGVMSVASRAHDVVPSGRCRGARVCRVRGGSVLRRRRTRLGGRRRGAWRRGGRGWGRRGLRPDRRGNRDDRGDRNTTQEMLHVLNSGLERTETLDHSAETLTSPLERVRSCPRPALGFRPARRFRPTNCPSGCQHPAGRIVPAPFVKTRLFTLAHSRAPIGDGL
jgi:hypothetical protein